MAGERILIVEDDVALIGLPLQRLLVAHHYDVVEAIARTTEEAVALTLMHQPDVVLLDICIPPAPRTPTNEVEGVNAARRIRALRHTGIVFVTCMKATDDLMRAVHEVSSDAIFLTRPLSDEQILASVKQVLMKQSVAAPVLRHCEVFVCYAREDRELEREMRQYLQPMAASGVRFWDDCKLKLGEHWKQAIDLALVTCDTAVVFVSIHFMNSNFIQTVEWPAIRKAHRGRDMHIIPIHVGHVPDASLQLSGLLDFNGLNAPDNPLKGKYWTPHRREKLVWVPLCNRLFENCSGQVSRSW